MNYYRRELPSHILNMLADALAVWGPSMKVNRSQTVRQIGRLLET